jgi:hypothetical protein
MVDPIDVSPQAMGLAVLEVISRVLDRLVAHHVLEEDEVTALLARAAVAQDHVGRPVNKEAADLLSWIADERVRKAGAAGTSQDRG